MLAKSMLDIFISMEGRRASCFSGDNLTDLPLTRSSVTKALSKIPSPISEVLSFRYSGRTAAAVGRTFTHIHLRVSLAGPTFQLKKTKNKKTSDNTV